MINKLLSYRLDQSVKETSNSNRAETVPINPEDYGDLPSVSPQEVSLPDLFLLKLLLDIFKASL